MISGALLEQLIPEISWIGDLELREKTKQALLYAMNNGGWDEKTISNSPVTLLRDTDISSVEHLRDVTVACEALYPIGKKYCERHGADFDHDTVIAAAILHDVGKYTEVIPDEKGRPHYSDSAKLMRHPLGGAIIAAQFGLPDKVVHAIATHSIEGDKSYMTAESQFVRKIDELVFATSVYGISIK